MNIKKKLPNGIVPPGVSSSLIGLIDTVTVFEIEDPIKNGEEFIKDVKKLTLEQLVSKYKKSRNTIKKNITYYLGNNFRKKRIRTHK